MKKLFILISVLFFIGLRCGAQGTVSFNNNVPGVVVEPIYLTFGGSRLGPNSSADLVFQTETGSLVPLLPRTTFLGNGFVDPVIVELPGTVPGQSVTLRMRAWVRDGFDPSFDGANFKSLSDPFTIELGGGELPPADLTGLRSFQLFLPEPGPIALGAVGMIFFALFRARR